MKRQKRAALLLFLFTFVLTSSFLLTAATPVYAQPIPVPATTVADVPATVKEVKTGVFDAILEGVVVTIFGAANYFFTTLAYEFATALVECPGQQACWETRMSAAVENAADGALGELVMGMGDELAQQAGFPDFAKMTGFSLCAPPDPNLTLNLQLGMMDDVNPPEPSCSWSDLKENYAKFDLTDPAKRDAMLDNMKVQFKPGQAPLSMSLSAFDGAAAIKAKAEKDTQLKLLMEAGAGGFSAVTDPVSERVKAPAKAAETEYEQMVKQRSENPTEFAASVSAGQVAKGAFASLAANVLQTFVMTLVTKLWNKLAQGILSLAEILQAQPDLVLSEFGVLQSPGGSAIRASFASRSLTPPIRSISSHDALALFSACPQKGRSTFHCVIDAGFATAVRLSAARPLTVQDAIDEGFLDGGKRFIPSALPKNRERLCFEEGYCESNLKKLRAARIIPVGWEIAAGKSSPENPPTLQEVVDGFNNCPTPSDPSSVGKEWCHLIDPNWVLKAPPAQCTKMAFGSTLVVPEGSERAEVCVDAPTCLKEDGFGNCTGGFAHCTEEKNVWRFYADSCPASRNSCRTLTSGTGENLNFLLNTIDRGVCNSENTGCSAYATVLNMDGTPGGDPNDATDDWLLDDVNRHVSRQVETCDVTSDGCTQLIRFGEGETFNIIKNGGFEDLEDRDKDSSFDSPKGWSWPRGMVPGGFNGHLDATGDHSAGGRSAMYLDALASQSGDCTLSCSDPSGCSCAHVHADGVVSGLKCLVENGQSACVVDQRLIQDNIHVKPNTRYTFSMELLSADVAHVDGTAELTLYNSFGEQLYVSTNPGFDAVVTTAPNMETGCVATGSGTVQITSIPEPLSGPVLESKLECQIIFTQGIDDDQIVFATLELWGDETYVDNIQLEEGVGTEFHEGYGSADDSVFAKVAPDYLGCTGDGGDLPECENYAGACRENEIGCLQYTPTSGSDPAVPAIAGPTDICPQECAGFDVFFKQTSIFEPSVTNPHYFIPDTATQCSSSHIGCAEFTDIANEQLAYFTELRICQLPEDDVAGVFYTWEGSDTTGYQLKTWQLKSTVGTMSDSSYDVALSGSDAGKAPCIALNNNSEVCRDSGGDQSGKCTASSIENGDFDCREFYDADGNRHYRKMSKVIFITDECSDYRITESTDQPNCNATNGFWNPSRDECVYKILPVLSRSCPVEANGCREYKGNTASNSSVMFSDTLEEEQTGVPGNYEVGLWRSSAAFQSVESLVLGGHSARIGPGPLSDIIRPTEDMIESGSQYTLSFWARGTGTLQIRIFADDSGTPPGAIPASSSCSNAGVAGSNCAFEDAELRSDWQQYTLGPLTIPTYAPWATADETVLRIYNPSGADQYVDNITLTRVRDNITVVQNAWSTPSSCNQNAFGQDAPLAMLGCREYRNSDGGLSYLKSFTRLCRDRSIGCAAYGDMQDTIEETHMQTFNAVCIMDTICSTSTAIGASCVCNYERSHTLVSGVPEIVYDACRVPIGASDCRFTLDGIDTATSNEIFPDKVLVGGDITRALVVDESSRCLVGEASCKVMGSPFYKYESTCALPDACSPDPMVCLSDNSIVCSDDNDCFAVLNYPDPCILSPIETCTCTDPETGGTCEVERGGLTCVYPRESGFIASWSAVSLKDDPSRYDQTLCLEEAVSCEAYTMSGGGETFFKNPAERVCEYKESVVLNGQRRSGWFRKSEGGGLFPCYPELLRSGREYEIYKNADPSCSIPSCSLREACQLTAGCECYGAGATNVDGVIGPDTTVSAGYTCTVKAGEFRCGQEECADSNGCECSRRYMVGSDPFDVEVCKVLEGRTSCGYGGWVGVCEGKWDRCEEFVDPFDSSGVNPEGEPYYFIENSKIDYAECAGTVSLKEGCVALKQTSNPRNIHSSGPSYRKSEDNLNRRVDPINCETNDPDPRCLNRCYRVLKGVCIVPGSEADSSHAECSSDMDCAGQGERCIGEMFLGASCTENAHCNGPMGEVCINLQNPPSPLQPIPILNDTNVIVKVTADRECQSWLQCRQAESIFDDNTNEWRTVCSAFGECIAQQEFGAAFECVDWSQPEKKIFTEKDYIERDVTWRGWDYSGYTLFNRYPAQYLQPTKVTRGACKDQAQGMWVQERIPSGTSDEFCLSDDPNLDPAGAAKGEDFCYEPLKTCITTEHPTSGCGEGQYCTPPLEGMCIGDTNAATRACQYSTDCVGDAQFCARTIAATQRYGIVREICAGICPNGIACINDDGCAGNDTCDMTFAGKDCFGDESDCGGNGAIEGMCVSSCEDNIDCPSDGTRAGERGQGTCYQSRCWYDFYGGALLDSNQSAAPICRAAPEKDSPFPFTVLQGGVAGYSENNTYQAASIKSEFKGAHVCTKDNECTCQYVRLGFGTGGHSTMYVSREEAEHVQVEDNNGARQDTQPTLLGLCVGGPFDGRLCNPELQYDYQDVGVSPTTGTRSNSSNGPGHCGRADGGGTCNILSTRIEAIGQFGFCVDYDHTLVRAGDPNNFVCHQWLPVDQLLGAPNLFNRYKEAGYRPPAGVEQMLYCQAARGNKITGSPTATPYYRKIIAGGKMFSNMKEVSGGDSISDYDDDSQSLDSWTTPVPANARNSFKRDDVEAIVVTMTGSGATFVLAPSPTDTEIPAGGTEPVARWWNATTFKGNSPEAGAYMNNELAPGGNENRDTACLYLMDEYLKGTSDSNLEKICSGESGSYTSGDGSSKGYRHLKYCGSGNPQPWVSGGGSCSGEGDDLENARLAEKETENCVGAHASFDADGNLEAINTIMCHNSAGDSYDDAKFWCTAAMITLGALCMPLALAVWPFGPAACGIAMGTVMIAMGLLDFTDDGGADTCYLGGGGGEQCGPLAYGATLDDDDNMAACKCGNTSNNPDCWVEYKVNGDGDNISGSSCSYDASGSSSAWDYVDDLATGSSCEYVLFGLWQSSFVKDFNTEVGLYTREMCTDYAHVYDAGEDITSVPWTNRIALAEQADGGDFDGYEVPYVVSSGHTGSHGGYVEMTPFGIPTTQAVPPLAPRPIPGSAVSDYYPNLIPIPAGADRGSPYQWATGGDNSNPDSLIAPTFDALGNISGGVPYACDGPCGDSAAPAPSVTDTRNRSSSDRSVFLPGGGGDATREQTNMDGEDRLSQMFAVSWGRYSGTINTARGLTYGDEDDISRAYTIAPAARPPYNWDIRFDVVEYEVNEPKVRPYDASSALGVGTGLCSGESCPEGHIGDPDVDGISINGESWLHPGMNNKGELCSSSGSYKAIIRYYVEAHTDQMPIRRKVIDFGDGSPPVSTFGWFKNHRGLYNQNSVIPAGYIQGDPICGSIADDWGLSGTACSTQYFEDQKTYVCSPDLIATLDVCDGDNRFPCTEGGGCIYRPRVQITDNWGVCNGTCKWGNDGSDICINQLVDEKEPVHFGGTPYTQECNSFLMDEMHRENYDGQIPLDDDAYVEAWPWTEFNGRVFVYPANSGISCN